MGASRSWTSACSSAWTRAAVELELACQRARRGGRRRALHRLLAESGFLPEPERVDPEHLLAFIEDAIWWYTTADEAVELTPEIATQVMIESSDPRSSHFREMRHQDMRPEHLFGRRMEMLTLAVLAQLRARANWHRIAREWMYGDRAVTELGRAGGRVLRGRSPRRTLTLIFRSAHVPTGGAARRGPAVPHVARPYDTLRRPGSAPGSSSPAGPLGRPAVMPTR